MFCNFCLNFKFFLTFVARVENFKIGVDNQTSKFSFDADFLLIEIICLNNFFSSPKSKIILSHSTPLKIHTKISFSHLIFRRSFFHFIKASLKLIKGLFPKPFSHQLSFCHILCPNVIPFLVYQVRSQKILLGLCHLQQKLFSD